jgi:hypothetical protein
MRFRRLIEQLKKLYSCFRGFDRRHKNHP